MPKALVRIAVLSNNLYNEQTRKLSLCNLDKFIDVTIVSEQAGVTKPDTKIFMETLKQLNCKPDEAVMIGDSWEGDILGAHKAGNTSHLVQSIWSSMPRS